MSRPDLQIILRRAALVLRNVAGVLLEPATEDSLNSIAAEMKICRADLIQILPVRILDEDSETDGSA